MPTAHPEIFAALCRPFPPNEVKTRNQAGRSLSYITARSAMNRLDEVLGPEAWRDSYTETEQGIKCRIEYRLVPDGEWLWKEDGGAQAGMPEIDNDEKSGYSDAFKRACVKLGIARYLYKDGVPTYDANGSAPAPVQAPASADMSAPVRPAPTHTPSRPAPAVNGMPPGFEPDGSIRKPNNGKGMFACCKEQQDKHQAEFIKPLNEWSKSQGMANRMVDWEGDALDNGWRYLCYLVAKHTGTLGSAPQAAPAPTANGNGDLAGLRSSIIARAGEVIQHATGQTPVDTEIGAKLKSHWRELFAGAEMPKFGTITNSEQLKTLLETLEVEFKEVSDSVPF
ncbi:MAG: Rad52/Rad22 family DNA repair protein [Isosphaeraceae bacterium]